MLSLINFISYLDTKLKEFQTVQKYTEIPLILKEPTEIHINVPYKSSDIGHPFIFFYQQKQRV